MIAYEQANKSFVEMILPIRVAFRRYWRLSWAPGITIFALVSLVALRLPPYYVADSLIFIQPQKVNSKIVEGPSRNDQNERLQSLIYEILSRGRLRAIMEQFNLYPQSQTVVAKEKALKTFQTQAIQVIPVISKTSKDDLVQTFRVQFSYGDAKVAYEVTKAISNLFIEESILTSKTETQGTEEFLDAQLNEARKKLEATESAVQKFVQENFGKLPEHLQSSVARLEHAQAQLATNTQLITANMSRISSLQQEVKLAERDAPPLTSGLGTVSADPNEGISQLESALAVLRTKYSDQHPDVIAIKKQIEVLKQRTGGSSPKPNSRPLEPRGSTAESRGVRREIAEAESQLASLKEENFNLKKTITQLEADIKLMPLKEQELIRIRRDYANVKLNYENLSAAKEQATMQSNLVSSQKGAQFRIVEPPALPVIPAGPPRLLIIAAGAVAGILCFASVPLLFFFLTGAFKFRDEIEEDLGVPVIGVIPPLDTQKAKGASRRGVIFSLFTSAALFISGSIAIFLTI